MLQRSQVNKFDLYSIDREIPETLGYWYRCYKKWKVKRNLVPRALFPGFGGGALLFVIINIYLIYSIYFGVGHFNFIQGYMLYK